MVDEKADPAAHPGDNRESTAAEDFGHPRGTLAIVILYGLLFALGWLGLYVFQFLGRGAPRP
jgi:hypothetical protein